MAYLQIALLFLCFNLLWIFIPGLGLYKVLIKGDHHWSFKFLLSYYLGFGALTILYYIQNLVGLPFGIAFLGPIVSAIMIFYWIRWGRKNLFGEGQKVRSAELGIVGLIFVLSAISFTIPNILARGGHTIRIYHDYLNHTGIITSLSHSFPCMDNKIYGLDFYYHYFYDLIFAMCKHIFGMRSFTLLMVGTPFVSAFTLGLALIALGHHLMGKKEYGRINQFGMYLGLLVSCVMLFPFNMVGATTPITWIANHSFSNANAMGVALSCIIIFMEYLNSIWDEKYDFRNNVTIILLAIVITGMKGPTSMMILVVMGVVFVVESFINHSKVLSKLSYVISYAIGFIPTYLLVVAGTSGSANNNRAMKLSPLGTLGFSRVCQVLTKLGIDYEGSLLWIVIAVVLCGICLMGPLVVIFTVVSIRKWKELIATKRIDDIFYWFSYGFVMVGIFGTLLVTIPGFSQSYMMMSAIPFLYYIVVKFMQGESEKADKNSSKVSWLCGFVWLVWIVGILFLVADVGVYVSKLPKAVAARSSSEREIAADAITDKDMDGYLWVKENTPENALVAFDRYTEDLDYRNIFFYGSAFTERQAYIEGYDYSDISAEKALDMVGMNECLYSSDEATVKAAVDVTGVDYVVVSKFAHENLECLDSVYEEVFNNGYVRVWKVK